MSLIEKFLNSKGYYKRTGNDYLIQELNINTDEFETKIRHLEKNRPFNEEKVIMATKLLLDGLGEDLNRPGLIDTPKRVMKYWKELTEGSHYTNKEIADMFRKDFQVSFDPIVFKECKNIFSHCEHHRSSYV